MENIRVAKVPDIRLEVGKRTYTGTLHLLAHQLLFIPDGVNRELWIGYSILRTVTKHHPLTDGVWPIHILCRNFMYFRLLIPREQDANDVYASLGKLMNITNFESLFAFYYQPSHANLLCNPLRGWHVYNPMKEYARMGVGTKTDQWRFTRINEEFGFSPTYPSALVVPAKISDNVLRHTAKFRSKSRIPALSYIHRTNMVSISRSSQPMVGLKNNRSAQDEALIKAIFSSSSVSPVAPHSNLILDARPTANAMANKGMGAGTEDPEVYKAKVVFCGIENIHALRDSWKGVTDAIQAANSGQISRVALEKSGWMKHVKNVLDAALSMVQHVHCYNSHVLVHCSDGWDRTAQLVSLASLCLDPYYRTIEGFCVLIEKEWCSFGHKFRERCGHLSSLPDTTTGSTDSMRQAVIDSAKLGFRSLRSATPSSSPSASGSNSNIPHGAMKESTTVSYEHSKEVSPVFTLFLDCVYQLWRQFPTHFEFSEIFLLALHMQVYNCQWGNFLFNCEREKLVFRKADDESGNVTATSKTIMEATYSVWDYFLNHGHNSHFLNSAYLTPEQRRMNREIVSSTAQSMSDLIAGESAENANKAAANANTTSEKAKDAPVKPTKTGANTAGASTSTSSLPSPAHETYVGLGIGSVGAIPGTPGTVSECGEVLFSTTKDLNFWYGLIHGHVLGTVESDDEDGGYWMGWETGMNPNLPTKLSSQPQPQPQQLSKPVNSDPKSSLAQQEQHPVSQSQRRSQPTSPEAFAYPGFAPPQPPSAAVTSREMNGWETDLNIPPPMGSLSTSSLASMNNDVGSVGELGVSGNVVSNGNPGNPWGDGGMNLPESSGLDGDGLLNPAQRMEEMSRRLDELTLAQQRGNAEQEDLVNAAPW